MRDMSAKDVEDTKDVTNHSNIVKRKRVAAVLRGKYSFLHNTFPLVSHCCKLIYYDSHNYYVLTISCVLPDECYENCTCES